MEDQNWKPVSYAHKKIPNYMEKSATIDWKTVTIYDYLDGTPAYLYWYNGVWQLASGCTIQCKSSH